MKAFIQFMSQNTSSIIELILVAAFVIEGLYQVISGKMINYAGTLDRYTKESVDRFARPSGAAVILEGVGIFLFAFSVEGAPLPGVLKWVGVVVMVISVVAYLVMMKMFLVKK